VRLRERDEVADRPGDDVAVTLKAAVPALRRAQRGGDVSSHGWLLGDDGGGHGKTRVRAGKGARWRARP